MTTFSVVYGKSRATFVSIAKLLSIDIRNEGAAYHDI